jgi:hypothetical protein
LDIDEKFTGEIGLQSFTPEDEQISFILFVISCSTCFGADQMKIKSVCPQAACWSAALIVCCASAFGLELLCEGLEGLRSESDFVELLKSLRIVDGVQCFADSLRTRTMTDFQGSLYSCPKGE